MSAAVRSAFRLALVLGPALALLAACSAPPTSARPPVVAVTTAGALVKLDPANGAIIATLVPSGVVGDEVSVSQDGSTVYFAQRSGCKSEIESVSSGGGNPTSIAPGTLPAISPDGSKLAFTDQPLL